MAVTINASIDGASYSNITKIITGGKTVNLSGIADGSDLPAQIAEIKYSTYTQESDSGSTKSFEHGCAGTPDIIVMWSDYKTRYTSESKPANTTIVGAVWNEPGGFKAYTSVGTSYAGSIASTSPASATLASTDDGYITNVGDTTFDILFKSNRRCGGGLTYSILAIRLA